MNNHLNILPKQASFDLKCYKMLWRLGLRPGPNWGSLQRSPDPLVGRGFAPSARATYYFLAPLYSSTPNLLPPQSNIPRTATASVPQLCGPPYLFSCNSTIENGIVTFHENFTNKYATGRW